jgi:hypothetical protein
MKWRHAVFFAGLSACRIGGPSADPYEYVAFPDAAMNDSSMSAAVPAGDDGSPASTGDDAGGDLDAGDLEAAPDDPDALCSSTVAVAVCDPVHNTGCNPLQQCDVNPSQTNTLTGQCIFGGGADGGVCTTSIFTDTCPARSTCVDGGCRQLCFCNADCAPGQCCSDRSGPPGFVLCGACGP